MDAQPKIAIISENTLCAMALRSLLTDMSLGAEICTYGSIEAYKAAKLEFVVHHFVSASIAFRHPEIFQPLIRRTIVIVDGSASSFVQSGYRTIDATASEQSIVRQILSMHHAGHPSGHMSQSAKPDSDSGELLSTREKDVLALIVRGYINKEIAEQLNISLATVVYHRNNISDKLKTRSIGRLTIYAVLNNIVSLSDI